MIALITPTGGRPYQFHLCQLWMKQQTYKGNVAWFIVDDCQPTSTGIIDDNFKPNWAIHKIYPTPCWEIGQNTQARNIAAGVRAMLDTYDKKDIEAIFIIEDDDYYKPGYLESMMPRINGFLAAGEINTIYYNVFHRRYIVNGNTTWSSLFQTALTVKALPTLEQCYKERYIDYVFFRRLEKVNLFKNGNMSVGIKGQAGRYGIGAGHQRTANMTEDVDWKYLTKLIGEEDAKYYNGYYSCLNMQ